MGYYNNSADKFRFIKDPNTNQYMMDVRTGVGNWTIPYDSNTYGNPMEEYGFNAETGSFDQNALRQAGGSEYRRALKPEYQDYFRQGYSQQQELPQEYFYQNPFESAMARQRNQFDAILNYQTTLNDLEAGNYSPQTQEAINRFQSDYGADGINKLKESYARQLKGVTPIQEGTSFEDWNQGLFNKRQSGGSGNALESPLSFSMPGAEQFYENQWLDFVPSAHLSGQGIDYQAKQDDFIRSQDGGTFGRFLKGAAPLLAVGAGMFAAPALASALGASGGAGLSSAATGLAAQGSLLPASAITGAAAGGAAGGTLGSVLTNFGKDAAIKGALKGGVSSLLSGGDLSDVLKGATLGGVTGGYGDAIGSSLGLSGAGQQAFTGGLTGATGGLASGDMKAAGIGALLGAGTGYLQGGGNVPGLGNVSTTGMSGSAGNLASQGSLLPQSLDYASGTGSGILGNMTQAGGLLSGGLSGGGSGSMYGNLGNVLKSGLGVYSGMEEKDALKEQQRAMQDAIAQAQGYYQPYMESGQQANQQLSDLLSQGFTPDDLYNDPGYQFQLEQGQKALQNQMSASGMRQSGAAMKAAQEYGQNLASTSYDDAYTRWLQNNQQLQGLAGQGMGAAGGMGNLATTGGQVNAQLAGAMADNRARTLANILSGTGSLFGGIY